MQGDLRYDDGRYAQSILTGIFFEDNLRLHSKTYKGKWTDNIRPFCPATPPSYSGRSWE